MVLKREKKKMLKKYKREKKMRPKKTCNEKTRQRPKKTKEKVPGVSSCEVKILSPMKD